MNMDRVRNTFLNIFVKKGQDGPRTVNIFFGFFLMINFVLGTGFLGIPYGFYSGGVLAGILTLFVISVISWMCAIFVLETMARCQALEDFKNHVEIHVSLNNSTVLRLSNFCITPIRKFEPSEQCQILLKFFGIEYVGYGMKVVYLLLLAAITFFACIAYCTVAGPAWAVNLPLHFGALEQCHTSDFNNVLIPHGGCHWSYRFCLFIFACIVVPLTLLDLKEQAFIQFFLGLMRFGTVGAIILYCLALFGMGDLLTECDGSQEHYPEINSSSSSIPYYNLTNGTPSIKELFIDYSFNGWLVSIPIFVYAHILHLGIPALTHPIKEKHLLRGYFNVLFLVLAVIYMSLGLVVSIWFRECTLENCTLNWGPYTKKPHHTALRALSYIIILFPSFDVCSAFPLIVHTTVNNVYTVIFGRDTSLDTGLKWQLIQRLMKFVAAVVPILIAVFVSNLVVVLNYAGIIGFFIAFFFPILLHLRSQWVCFQTFRYTLEDNNGYSDSIKLESPLLGPPDNPKKPGLANDLFEFMFTTRKAVLYKTPYSMFFSYPIVVVGIGFISFMTLVFTIVSLIV